ncbi:Uncharacterized conserved protein, DUF952 family [Paracoccus sediminis]|uniref:Uncharacterized conserved protein, DUF952 family n=2 Tax=Paracoccus sediminis TaxID=1214787 RepID=A0A238XKN1_9RHOB|nr:Uncharacterized conserved protein, DUF952 family [Paracoccus sediminis]
MRLMMIFKMFRPGEWAELLTKGWTGGAPVDLHDGFVHFSTAAQVPETLTRHFVNDDALVLLACDAARFGDDLRWEPSRGGDLFPHLYRALTLDDVAWTRDIGFGPQRHNTGPLE